MKVSLIVPTLNERQAIEALLAGIANAHARFAATTEFEVIIVDDGSIDGTVALARSISTPFPIKVIERQERGLATAVLRGFAEAHGEAMGVMDADLSHPTELLQPLIAALDHAELVVASRHIQGGAVEEWPWYRKFASWFATQLTRPLGIQVSDPMSGYFFLRRSVLDGVHCSPIGYKILLEVILKGKYQRIQEIGYVFRNREVGKSKMGWRESWNYIKHLVRLYHWKMFRC